MAGPNITNITRRDQRRRKKASAPPTTTTTTKDEERVHVRSRSASPARDRRTIEREYLPNPDLYKNKTFKGILNRLIIGDITLAQMDKAQKRKKTNVDWEMWKATIKVDPDYKKAVAQRKANDKALRDAEVARKSKLRANEIEAMQRREDRSGKLHKDIIAGEIHDPWKRITKNKKAREGAMKKREEIQAEARESQAKARRKKARSERMEGIDTQTSRRKSGGLVNKTYKNTTRTPKRA